MDDDAGFDGGLTEDDLMDDAEVDTMVREAVTSAVGDNQVTFARGPLGNAAVEILASFLAD